MQKVIHRSLERGETDIGWLKSRHSFSFGSYLDMDKMGFGTLRVINDDIVAPARGFDTHAHQNMEIISIPLKGLLRHQDTIGNSFLIKSGEVQIMSAGSGISHSEYNHSITEEVHFLQIWVLPDKKNTRPSYSKKKFIDFSSPGILQLIVSPDGRGNSVPINQQAFFSIGTFDRDHRFEYSLYSADNKVYVFVLEGKFEIANEILASRDGIGVIGENKFNITSKDQGQILLMEIP